MATTPINGLTYTIGGTFTCAKAVGGNGSSEGDGKPSINLKVGSTYYLLRVIPGAKYPYKVGTSSSQSSVIAWYTSEVFQSCENPNAPTNVENKRISDTRNTVSWEAPKTSFTKPVSSILIERSVDGGSWSQIESVSSSSTSYADTTTSANHSYQYRIRACNSTGYSSYATCSTVLYNTPSEPSKVTASRLAETTVKLEIENTANTATALEYQRSTNGDTWETVATVEGSPVTETTDEPGGGTFYYRARNTRGEMFSDWSPASNAVVTICAPAAPTLKTPASGVVVPKSQEAVTFAWAHNPIDGSAQTAAKLRYSTDKGQTYTEVPIDGNAASYALGNAFAVNAEVTWGVCTKGAHADWGPWSDNRVFFVYQAPSVAFAQPADGFVVENMPIHIELQYDDPSGTLANAELTVKDEAGVVFSANMATATNRTITVSDWLPENGKSYTINVSVRSSSTLTATAKRDITVAFIPPQPASLVITPDSETGYVGILVETINDTSKNGAILGVGTLGEMIIGTPDGSRAESKYANVYRVHNGSRVLIGEKLTDGYALVDKYAPLNEDYQYDVVTFAESGAVEKTAFNTRIKTKWAFLYFAGGGIARGMWNPDDSWKIDQDVDFVHYIGREYPVAYMRDSMDETHNVAVTLMDREEMRAFRKMMSSHEPVVAKLWDSLVFHAVPQLQGKPKATVGSYWGDVGVTLTRIDGEAL